jgi:hypothetical protein
MSNFDDGIFNQWVEEAKIEVSKLGWREAPINALLLLCHDMSARNRNQMERLMRGPIKWFVGLLTTGVVWMIVRDLLINH